MGDFSNGPRLLNPQTKNNGLILSDQLDSPVGDTQLNSVGPNVRDLGPFELLTLGLGPSLPTINLPSFILNASFWCSEIGDTPVGEIPKLSSKKRIIKEIGKFGRNIKQRLLCGLIDRENNQIQDVSNQETSIDADITAGFQEAGL